ncbi:MAG: hypothetical protein JSW47_21685, partial [Phycisphaerales bacterium]
KTAQYTRESLSEESMEGASLFDAGKVARLLRKLQNIDNPSEIDSMALVGILSSQLVYQQFIEGFSRGSACSASPGLVVDRRSQALKLAN